MEKCAVNKVYAPNGEVSKLYTDLRKELKDQSQALSMWIMVQTPEFKKIHGDWKSDDFEGELDENGEPLMDDILKDEYMEDAMVMRAVEQDAEGYIESSKKLTKYKEDMTKVLTRKIAELGRSSTKGSTQFKNKLEKLRNNLKKLEWREATQDFSVSAKKSIDFGLKRLEAELRKEEPNTALLTRYRNYISAFDMLNDIKLEIEGNPMMESSMQEELEMLSDLIKTKERGKKLYRDFMEKHVAEKLASVSDKHDAKAIKEFLKRAPFDIKAKEYWMRFAGDSRDTVIALVAKTINEQQQKTRKKSIEFTKELSDRLEKLEAAYPQYKGNPEKLYDAMLERDSKGNLTGYFIKNKEGNKRYEAFKKKYENTEIFEFYNFFTTEYARLNDALPPTYRMGNKLPTMLKSTIDRLTTGEGKLGQVKAHARNKFEATNTDISTGEMVDENGKVIHQVPIHYTQSYDSAVYNTKKRELLKKGVGESTAEKEAVEYAVEQLPKHLSYDIGSSLQAFHYMAENYSDMNEILDVVEGAKDMVKSRKSVKTDSMGKAILSKMKDMDNDPIEIEGSASNAYKMIESLVESQVYGITEKDIGSSVVFGMQLDHRKLIKQISKYNSTLMLGANFMAGTANIMMGQSMQWADAFGGQYYNKKNYLKSKMIYNSHLTEMLGDVGRRTPQSKINLINQHYDILGDYFPDGVGAADSSSVRRAVKNSSVFFINSIGEHTMQSRAMIAVMLSTPVFNSEGVSRGNLFDSHEAVNGKLEIAEDIFIKNSEGELVPFDGKQENTLSRKTQTMLRRMHGNYNRQTAAHWQRSALLGLVGQFRKWINDGFARRWDKKSYNEFAEGDLEGNYRTTGRFIASLKTNFEELGFDITRHWDTMSEVEKSNVAKTIYEVGTYVAMSISAAILTALASGLDEDEDKAKLAALRHGQYLVNRLSNELLFFAWPPDAWQILKSPAASMTVIQQTATTLTYALPWNWTEKYEAGINKDSNKFLHNLGKQVPLYKQLGRMSPDGIKGQLQLYNIN